MPRSTQPRYRFRRYTRSFAKPVSRQLARCVPWGRRRHVGNVPPRSRCRPVAGPRRSRPVRVRAGHPPRPSHPGRGDSRIAASRHSRIPAADTRHRRTAAGEPGLGRRQATRSTAAGRPVSGSRYFRVRATGLPRRRRFRRILVELNVASGRVRITLRLSERQAQQLLARLERTAPAGQRDLPSVLLGLQEQVSRTLPATLAARFLKRALAADASGAQQMADRVVASTTAGLSAFLTTNAAQLTTAVRDPADGVTITLTSTASPGRSWPATCRPRRSRSRPDGPPVPDDVLAERVTLDAELRHWREAARPWLTWTSVAAPTAWAQLESYLGLSVRASLRAVAAARHCQAERVSAGPRRSHRTRRARPGTRGDAAASPATMSRPRR